MEMIYQFLSWIGGLFRPSIKNTYDKCLICETDDDLYTFILNTAEGELSVSFCKDHMPEMVEAKTGRQLREEYYNGEIDIE